MSDPIKLASARSERGSSQPAFIDLDGPQGGLSIATTLQRVKIYTNNGKRNLSANKIIFERYPNNLNSTTERDNATPLITSTVPISGYKQKLIEYEATNEIYALVSGNNPTKDTGLRIRLESKDRDSDFQYLFIGYHVLANNQR